MDGELRAGGWQRPRLTRACFRKPGCWEPALGMENRPLEALSPDTDSSWEGLDSRKAGDAPWRDTQWLRR